MATILPTFPTQPCFSYTITLGSAQYGLTWTWRARCAAWYLDVVDSGGSAVVLGRRVSPGWDLLHGLLPVGVPSGYLLVSGPDPYTQDMLGTDVLVVWYDATEIPPPTTTSDLLVT